MDWKKLSSDIIASAGDQGKLTQVLSDLETEVTTFNTRFSDLEKQHQGQAEQIESLQKTNMNLFLKVGNPVNSEKLNSAEPGTQLTYDDLLGSFGVKTNE